MEHVPCGGHTVNVHFTEESAMSKQELYEQMVALFAQFQEGHNATTKKGAAQARKAASGIKKLITPYNQASVAADKEK